MRVTIEERLEAAMAIDETVRHATTVATERRLGTIETLMFVVEVLVLEKTNRCKSIDELVEKGLVR